jgi:hypothetical protein
MGHFRFPFSFCGLAQTSLTLYKVLFIGQPAPGDDNAVACSHLSLHGRVNA